MYSGQSVNRLVHQISHQFFSLCNRYLKEHDLTKQQLDILRYVYERQSRNEITMQKDIERYFSISNPTVSNMLTRLENKQLLYRESSMEDKRIRCIRLSSLGERLYESLRDEFAIMENQMTAGLSQQELAAGTEFLEKLLANLKKWKGDANA